ncbi:hypothetical protein MTR_3g012390 [Medicago truncatula]|uniref:Uncharacterized protein n=1 Tax=Medicago truncatula TaxID=3880 RepID=A0A072UVA0_MEDTR|nr:hypothetical protein MTR_3g012390 [Medicago truncatula]
MLRIGGLLIAGCPKWIVPDRMQLLCLLILNFCIDRPFGFSIYQDNLFVHVSNFCLDRPFGFSVHRDAHFCLSHLFRFATYRTFMFDRVFLDCTDIQRKCEFVTICSHEGHCTRAFIVRRPLALGVWLESFDGYDAPACERSHREPLHFPLLQLRIQGIQSS